MSERLALYLLGPPRLELDHTAVSIDRRKTLALIAYLAVNRWQHHRDHISALLWPEYEQAKAFTNLRHILWEVQQAIGEGWVVASRDTVGLIPDANPLSPSAGAECVVWLDVACFQSLLAQARTQKEVTLRIPLLTDSVDLYRNHFLAGFSLKHSHIFNEWSHAEFEALCHQLASALMVLAEDYCSLGQAETAIPYAQRLVALDSLNEASHRQLMQVYIQAGKQNAALKQYQICEQILRKELGVDPQPETRALYKQMRKREIKPIRPIKGKETGAAQHNLPFQISTFIGREKELREVTDLAANHRLVSLIGTGGIGKTRLSLKVGERLLNEYADGVWLVELAPLSDPALVPQTVAALFNLVEGSNDSLTEKLIHSFLPKTILLILDNCEHVLDACAQLVGALLRNCPNVKILATSREPLGITGEAQYHVPPLELPDIQLLLEQLLGYESVQLFEERARLVQEHFSLTMENAPSIAKICQRLDGIPLAIELAAARVNLLSTEQIAVRLDESFNLLTGGSRTILPRHQTLRASIDWSWKLLSIPEQILLRRLAVFAGGWTLKAVETVCTGNGIDPSQVLDGMTQLVGKSLVVVNQETRGESRYRLLEMVRQYAHEKLVEKGEEEGIRNQHLNYYFNLAMQAETELTGPRQMIWMERLEEELDNIRSSLEWSLNGIELRTDIGLQMAGSLWWFWYSRGHAREGGGWLERTLALTVSQAPADLVIRAKGLSKLGHLTVNLARIEESIALSQALGEEGRESLAFGLWVLGAWSYFYADFDRAKSLEEASLKLHRETGNRWGMCESLTWLGAALTRLGEDQLAMPFFQESLKLARQAQDSNEMAWALWHLGKLERSRGEFEKSRNYLEESLALYRAIQGYDGITFLLGTLGDLALICGEDEEADSRYKETLTMQYRRSNQRGIAEALEKMGNAAAVRKRPERAARLLGAAQILRNSSGSHHYPYQLIEYEQFLAALQPQLESARLTTLLSEDEAMTVEQAMEYALEER